MNYHRTIRHGIGRPFLAAAVLEGVVGSQSARASITEDLIRAESRLKARAMIDEWNAGEGAYRAGGNEYFPVALSLAVLNELGDPTLDDAPDIDRLWAETARTDKQNGAGAVSPASTTLTERPGLPCLLTLAVEHGAIEQESNGTSMTLTTSAYSVVAALEGDTAENYRDYNFWTRLGASATANLEDTGDGDKGDLDYEDFAQIALKVRLWGDRSVRSDKFVEAWHNRMGDPIDRDLESESRLQQEVFSKLPADMRRDAVKRLIDALAEPVREGNLKAVQEAFVTQVLLVGKQLRESHPDIDSLRAIALRELKILVKAYQTLIAARTSDISGFYAELMREAVPSVMSLKYTLNRIEGSSDFSEGDFLFQHDFTRGNVILNGGISLYHNKDSSLGQDTVRDYSGAITFETTFENTIIPKANSQDETPILLSASGRVSRNEQIDDEIVTVQAKIEIPLGTGLKIPIGVTYANRTLEEDDEDVRVNVGAQVDGDQLFNLGRIRSLAGVLAGR